ncbi:MAG: DUF1287 domain-containing protein [Gallionella sp.]|nr:DUF1287 domain-containing protein [Gallionella sp.]MDD4947155.1 DUF1287 domain-containing protein [Gallionella sp.]MDD5612137.1 DUF1287 domain-containing protein [Gallionella sp.]
MIHPAIGIAYRGFSCQTLCALHETMMRIVIRFILLGIAFGGVVYAIGYHGQRSFQYPLAVLPEVSNVVKAAKELSGTPYDPLMGAHGNIGATAGFIVCSDVPNLAYGLAGYSLQTMLERDFKVHPNAYNTANGNVPGNPYFHRRARNLFSYFQANGRALPPDAIPKVGDLAFYQHDPKSYVTHVALVTAVEGNRYWVMESAPETVLAKEVSGTSPISRGWLLVGYGRMYQDAHSNSRQAGRP